MTLKNELKNNLEWWLNSSHIQFARIETHKKNLITVVISDFNLPEHCISNTQYINHLKIENVHGIERDLLHWVQAYDGHDSFQLCLKRINPMNVNYYKLINQKKR